MTPDANETKQVAVLEKGQESTGKTQKDSKTKVYTEEEVERKFSLQRSALDIKIRILEKEKQDAIVRAEKVEKAKDAELKELNEKREQLEAELEEMARDDPDKARLFKKLKALDIKEVELKKKIADAEVQAETLKAEYEALSPEREIRRTNVMGKIASEYKNADMDKLRAICDKNEIATNDEDAIREYAGIFWDKIEGSQEEGKVPPHADSGENKGGSHEITQEEKDKKRYPSMFPKK